MRSRTETAGRLTERAVSPVIGVVVLLGGTLLLAAVVTPFIFSVTDEVGDDIPSAEFSFSYTETDDPEIEDSFGNTRADVDGDGLLQISLERGSDLDASALSVEGGASGGNLTAGGYSAGDEVALGEELTVWVQRGETINVIWDSADVEESAILAQYPVFPVSNLPPGAPEPDYDCDSWAFPADFDAQPGITADSSSLTVDGVVLKCEIDEYDIDDVDIVNDGAIIGNVVANNDVNMQNGAAYGGYVEAETGKLDIDQGSEINGDVEAANGVDLDDASIIRGDVNAGDDVNLQGGSEIVGDLRASANDVVIDSSTVSGSIIADANVNLDAGYVDGDIDGTENVGLDTMSVVTGDVIVPDLGDDLTCNDGNDSRINGEGCSDYKS